MESVDDGSTPPVAPSEENGGGQGKKAKWLNINIGILGHVDSGKTSLVAALSTKFSTASLDKHPQSKERGITLDLGFSAFELESNEEIKKHGFDTVQYTLVDCPGHASLIRTIIGGAQIIDRMILVVDVTKGIQTQTAECLVIGEILTNDLVVVLNKIDLLPEASRAEKVDAVTKTLEKALAGTRFKESPIIPVSANVGGDGKQGIGTSERSSIGLDTLTSLIRDTTTMPDRGAVDSMPLYFSIDHCFPIKGQGTVLTGTVMGGSIKVGQTVEIPQLKEERKVKSMQMFRQPVEYAAKGDRVAVCVTNLNAKLLERGVLTTPGSVPTTTGVIALVRKVKYFPMECMSGSKIHITVGHSTTLATATFFGCDELTDLAKETLGKDIPYLGEFDFSKEFQLDEKLFSGKDKKRPALSWALLNFETPIICQTGSMILGSRLDLEINTKVCRIAFYGRVNHQYSKPLDKEILQPLKVYKSKIREGVVDRVVDKKPMNDGKIQNVIARGMFSKDADLERFIGKEIDTSNPEEKGYIESSFGKTGKFKVVFRDGAKLDKGDKVFLKFKHMLYAPSQENKKILQ